MENPKSCVLVSNGVKQVCTNDECLMFKSRKSNSPISFKFKN